MSVELTITWVVIIAGLIPLAAVLRSAPARVVLVLIAAGLGAGAWHWHGLRKQEESLRSRLLEKAPREGRPGDYIGSSACRGCHPSEFETWHDSYHRTMTQYPSPKNVRGNFDRVTLTFDGDSYHLENDAEGYWVEMVDPDWKYSQLLKQAAYRDGRGPPVAPESKPPRARLPVTLMTGSHHMQTYWVPSRFGNLQFNLPFTYLFESERWAPRHDVFLLNPDKHYSMQMWNTVCLNCHSTAGQPRQDPKTKQLDSQAAEMGISCEACHGPGGEHVRVNQSPVRRYTQHSRAARSFRVARSTPAAPDAPAAGDPTIFNPGRADHVKSSETCGQCHAIRLKVNGADWFQHGLQFKPGGDLEAQAPLVQYEATNVAGHEWLAPYLAQMLVDPYSVVRYIAQRSLRRLPGFDHFDYDYIGPADHRAQASRRARQVWDQGRISPAPAGVTSRRSAVLLRPDGTLDEASFRAHLGFRNDRKMELLE